MRKPLNYFLLFTVMLLLQHRAMAMRDTTININVNAAKVVGQVNKNIYGHLLEHIYHSINGGLWGEMLASRSFEPEGTKGWYLQGDNIVSAGTRTSVLWLGKKTWADYEISGQVQWEPYFVGVPAPWSGGQSDIRIVFRNGADSVAYAVHLNATDEKPFALERLTTGKSISGITLLKAEKSPDENLLKPRQWHRFNIKCKGAEVTMAMDDQQVLTFTDEHAPLITGNVGLFLTKTTGRFKNIRVKSLTGEILWNDLPAEVKPTNVAPDWLADGNGNFELSKGQAVNGDYTQKITVNGPQAAVKQQVLNIKAHQYYYGSVWLHGDTGLKTSISFKDGEKVLAQTNLHPLSSGWKKYNFKLKVSGSAAKADFVISVKGSGSIWLDQASLMSASSVGNGGYQPELYRAVAGLQPSHLRWPGGSYASGYNWRWGIGPQQNRQRLAKSSWDDFEQNAFGTDEFLKLCKKIGSAPLLVIRIGYDQPDSARPALIKSAQDWIEYCNGSIKTNMGKLRAKNGHPQPYGVKYWEIDNEMWELGVEKYGEILRAFVPALKKIDPGIKIIACGDFTEKGKSRDSMLFNTSAKYFDYISLHHYESPARYREGPITMAKKYHDEERWIAASANPAIKLYISEWNASETDWRTGLYAGGLLNVFENDSHIAMAAAALLLRRTDATGWNNAFINFNGNKWFAATNYVVTKLYREHYQPDRLQVNGNTGAVSVVATRSANGKRLVLKLVNPTNSKVNIKLNVAGFKMPAGSALFMVAPGALQARNTMESPNLIKPVKINLENKQHTCTYTLPAFAVAVWETGI